MIGNARHPLIINTLLLGDTNNGRKGDATETALHDAAEQARAAAVGEEARPCGQGSALGLAVDEHGNIRPGWVVPGGYPQQAATSAAPPAGASPRGNPWRDYDDDDGGDHRPTFQRLRDEGHAIGRPPRV
jgi:hypothetical protein